MTRDHQDCLIDQLLREMLGNDRPRDLTERVMANARAYDRVRLRWWTGSISGIAAAIAIAGILWMVWPRSYPEPNFVVEDTRETKPDTVTDPNLKIDPAALEPPYDVLNGAKVQRGARIETREGKNAAFNLGGYVRVRFQPSTVATLGGSPYHEKVLLERGQVFSNVTKHVGEYDVIVGPATVHVTGTKFAVRTAPNGRGVGVRVDEGNVQLQGVVGGPVDLRGGMLEFVFFNFPNGFRLPLPAAAQAAPPAGPQAGNVSAGLSDQPILMAADAPAELPHLPAIAPTAPKVLPTVQPMVVPDLKSKLLQVVMQRENFSVEGTLRRERDVYFVDTQQGPYLLFAQQLAFDQMPAAGSRVHVLWSNGKLDRVDAADTKVSDRPPATRPAEIHKPTEGLAVQVKKTDTTPEPNWKPMETPRVEKITERREERRAGTTERTGQR